MYCVFSPVKSFGILETTIKFRLEAFCMKQNLPEIVVPLFFSSLLIFVAQLTAYLWTVSAGLYGLMHTKNGHVDVRTLSYNLYCTHVYILYLCLWFNILMKVYLHGVFFSVCSTWRLALLPRYVGKGIRPPGEVLVAIMSNAALNRTRGR